MPVWLAVTLLFFAEFVLALFAYVFNSPLAGLIILPGLVVVTVLSVYYWRRFGVSRLVFSPLVVRDRTNLGDPEDQPRLADRQERAAQRDLRRGKLSRQQYEKIIAYRHFVHGEISRAEYHHIISELDAAPTPAVRVKKARSSTPEGSSYPR